MMANWVPASTATDLSFKHGFLSNDEELYPGAGYLPPSDVDLPPRHHDKPSLPTAPARNSELGTGNSGSRLRVGSSSALMGHVQHANSAWESDLDREFPMPMEGHESDEVLDMFSSVAMTNTHSEQRGRGGTQFGVPQPEDDGNQHAYVMAMHDQGTTEEQEFLGGDNELDMQYMAPQETQNLQPWSPSSGTAAVRHKAACNQTYGTIAAPQKRGSSKREYGSFSSDGTHEMSMDDGSLMAGQESMQSTRSQPKRKRFRRDVLLDNLSAQINMIRRSNDDIKEYLRQEHDQNGMVKEAVATLSALMERTVQDNAALQERLAFLKPATEVNPDNVDGVQVEVAKLKDTMRVRKNMQRHTHHVTARP